VQISEGSIIRFRCHTGHAFSLQTLLEGVNDSIEAGLWATVRALEERLMLLRQICDIARMHGTLAEVQRCEEQARHVESRLAAARDLVLDKELFGSGGTQLTPQAGAHA
jgi:two-component system chemotaxis response regulator CheB